MDRSVGLAASWFGRWYRVGNYWGTSLGGHHLEDAGASSTSISGRVWVGDVNCGRWGW